MKKMKEGIPAQYNYQDVRYFPFHVFPGASYVLTADPWSYLFSRLQDKAIGKRGDNRKLYENAIYYANLAEGFYDAYKISPMPVKSTLAYYGMLNLVKVLISIKESKLLGSEEKEHHGLSITEKETIRVHPKMDNAINIFYFFAKYLGNDNYNNQQLSLKEICSHVPEIYEIAFHIGCFHPRKKRTFLPIMIDFYVNEDKQYVFTEIKYKKENEIRVNTEKFYLGNRETYFNLKDKENGTIKYRSKNRKKINKDNWPRIYAHIRQEYSNFNIASILTHTGYKYYCNLETPLFHNLCYSFMLLFYIGSVVRYRPSEIDSLMKSKFRPLISEAVEICPIQFLYSMTSYITNSVCVLPDSKLNFS